MSARERIDDWVTRNPHWAGITYLTVFYGYILISSRW